MSMLNFLFGWYWFSVWYADYAQNLDEMGGM